MEGIFERDDLMLLWPGVLPAITPRELESGFVSFTSGVGKKHPLSERKVAKGFGQAQSWLVGHDIGEVPDFFCLLLQGPYQTRVRMPQTIHRNATLKIYKLAVVLIPYTGTLASHRNNGTGRIVGHHDFIKQFATHRFFVHRSLSGKQVSLQK